MQAKDAQLEIHILKQLDEIEIIQRAISIKEEENHEKRTAKRQKEEAKVMSLNYNQSS